MSEKMQLLTSHITKTMADIVTILHYVTQIQDTNYTTSPDGWDSKLTGYKLNGQCSIPGRGTDYSFRLGPIISPHLRG